MLLSILLVSLFTAVSTVTALPNKQLDDPLGLANVYNEARSVPANEVEARQTWIPCGKAYSARNMIPLSARLGSPVCTYWAGDHGLTQYVMAPQGHKVEPCLCWFFIAPGCNKNSPDMVRRAKSWAGKPAYGDLPFGGVNWFTCE